MVRSVRFMVTGPYRGKGYFPCLGTLPGLSVSELAGHETFAGFKLSQAMCCSRLRPAGNSESASRRLATRWSTGRRWTVTDPHGPPRTQKTSSATETVTHSHAVSQADTPFGQNRVTAEADKRASETHFRCSEAFLVLVGDTGIEPDSPQVSDLRKRALTCGYVSA
jgi:hypothetical protein